MDDPEFSLSWFINPHVIWIRTSTIGPDFVRFEHELDEYYKNNKNLRHDVYKPKVGDVSTFLCVSMDLPVRMIKFLLIDGRLL